jgi:hypothetical protein
MFLKNHNILHTLPSRKRAENVRIVKRVWEVMDRGEGGSEIEV